MTVRLYVIRSGPAHICSMKGVTSADICHDALVDLASEEPFQAPNDVAFGPSVGGASCHIVDRRLVVSHTDNDRPIEGGAGLSMAPR